MISFFNNLYLLKPSDFKLNLNNAQDNLEEKLKNIKINKEYNDEFDNAFSGDDEKIDEDSLEQILQSLKFQRQTCESFYKLIIQNLLTSNKKN